MTKRLVVGGWWLVVLALLLFAVGCRTARPVGAPMAGLSAATAEEAMVQLRERRASFSGARSLMRVRAAANGKTQSFRAQLVVHDANRMELIAYTPVGTTALTVRAEGDRVSVDNRLEGSEWEGTSAELARSFGIFGASIPPAEMAMLILGIPPGESLQGAEAQSLSEQPLRPEASETRRLTYEVTPAGLARASAADVTVVFDPPSFPAKNVVVTRGGDRIEIEHLEVVAE